ncbi:MAG TPA: site-specific integrase [Bacteroidia bacterium]|jgi:integrase
MKTNFNLKKQNSDGLSLILLIMRWDNRKLVFSTRECIDPKYWGHDKTKKGYQRVIETRQYPEYPEFNARLDHLEASAKTVFRQFLNDNDHRSPTPQELKKLLNISLKRVQKNRIDLFGFIQVYIKEAKNRYNDETGKALAKGTIKVYENTLVTLKQYCSKRKVLLDFENIDLDWYKDYIEFLSKEKNLSLNTVGRNVKTLKAMLNEAFERGCHSNLAFRSKKFRVLTEATDSIYLDEFELQQLYDLDLTNEPRLEQIRDLFIVGCYTGLRFSDFSAIERKHIKGDFIEILTKKTAETVVIPIHRLIKEIMLKYTGVTANGLPPAISNAKTNKNLKVIAAMLPCLHVNVQSKVTKGGKVVTSTNPKHSMVVTHTARRSFATNLYKSGLSSLTIMKITGHRTEKAFIRYIKVTPTENAQLLQQHWDKQTQYKPTLEVA